jgi:hypothetical protein
MFNALYSGLQTLRSIVGHKSKDLRQLGWCESLNLSQFGSDQATRL